MPDVVDPIVEQMKAEQAGAAAPSLPPLVAPATQLPDTLAAPEVDPIVEQMKAEAEAEKQLQGNLLRFRATKDAADAGTRADVLRYTAAAPQAGLGYLTPDFVEKNLAQVKQKVDAEQVDWHAVAYRQPKLTEFMLENPAATPLVKDDVAQLGGLEWALKAPWHAFVDALHQQVTAGRQFAEVKGFGSAENRQAIAESEKAYGEKDYGAENFVSRALVKTAGMMPFLVGDTAARAAGGWLGVALGGAGGAGAGGAAGAPAAGAGAAPGAAAGGIGGMFGGAAVGQFAASGVFNYYEAVGPLYDRLSKLRDAQGNPLDPGVARAFAESSAMMQGALMGGFMGKVGASLPGVKQLLAKVSGTTLDKALVSVSVNQALKRGALNFGQHWVTGATMMGTQSAMNALAEEGAKGASGPGFEAQWSNAGEAAANGFVAGLEDMWLLSAIGPGREMVSDVGRARASATSAARLSVMAEAAAKSKLLERSPGAFEKAVGKMADGEQAYIPADRWVAYWSEKKVDPGEMAEKVAPGAGKALGEALETKGDVAFPVEKYLGVLGKTEHVKGLEMDVKLSADELTPRQFGEEQARLQAKLKEEAVSRGTEIEAGKRAVYDFIFDQARGAGIARDVAETNATIAAEWAGTAALRLGVDVREVAATGAFANLRILGPQGEAVAAAAREKFRSWMAPEASQLLARRLETMEPEARVREAYIDTNTGILNERAFHDLGANPEKPLVGMLGPEGIKVLNDTVSHDRADELYRMVGRALQAIDPEAAKVGGDFAVRVKDAAELADIVRRVNEALPVKGFEVTGAVGKTVKDADLAHRKMKIDAETAGTRARRGEKPLGLQGDVKAVVFPTEKAPELVPERLVEGVGSLTGKEYFDKVYTDPNTGLLTIDGWNNIPRKAYVASIDVRGLKAMNEAFGDDAGDAMLRVFGKIASHFGGAGVDMARLHGDEYAAQHSDPQQLQAFLDRLRGALKGVDIPATLKTGEKVDLTRDIEFRSGIGKDYADADAELNAGRAREAAAQGAVGGPDAGGAGGAGGGGNQPQRRADLVGRREALGRGARPQGFPGDRGGRSGAGEEVVAHIEGAPVTFKAEGKPGEDARGSIQLSVGPDGRPRAFDIRLFGTSDKSVLLHELGGHFLSWSLHDLATSDLSTPELRSDYAALLKWAGYASPEERQAATKEKQELLSKADLAGERMDKARLRALDAREERLSYGFEQYVAEGKAPSAALARVFSRMARWMKSVYAGVLGVQRQYRETYGQELELSDTVRGVFDRLFARSEALDTARREAGVPDAPAADLFEAMTPAERVEYRKALAEARLAEETETASRTADLETGKIEEERIRIGQEVAEQLDAQPIYRATRYLQEGEAVDASGRILDEVPEPLLDKEGRTFKLNRPAFVAAHGADAARLMPARVFASKASEGVAIDDLAPLLGFESGPELLDALLRTTPREDAIRQGTEARIDAEYGPVMKRISEAAMAAVHTDATARVRLLELRAMAKAMDPAAAARVRTVDLETLKRTAASIIGGTEVGSLDPARYQRAERQAALRAAELRGRKQKGPAAEEQEAAVLNGVLYRAARDMKERLDAQEEQFSHPSDAVRAAMGKADPSFRDVHDDVLAAVGLGPKQPTEHGLEEMLKRAEQDAQDVAFDVDFIRELLTKPKEWRTLTVGDASAVADAITNIRHLAKQAQVLNLAGKQQSRDAWFQDFVAHVTKRKPLPPLPFSAEDTTLAQKLGHLGRGAEAYLSDVPETFSHYLDVGDRAGPVHRLLVDARLEAREKHAELSKRVLERIVSKWESVPKEIRALRDSTVPGLEAILTPLQGGATGLVAAPRKRSVLWMLYLNWGGADNRQRIRDGNGWTDAAVEKALSLLTKPEIDFLNEVAATVGSLYPDIAALHEKRTGLQLGKAEVAPIVLNGEQVSAGHYWPLKYRTDVGARPGELQEGDAIKALFSPSYVRASTARGHTKSRVEKVNAPVDLSWGVVPAHLGQVIQDLSHGEWVRQVGGIFFDPSFKRLSQQYLGAERAKEFLPWLKDVANARADSAAGAQNQFAAEWEAFARNRAAVTIMGANLPNVAQQVLDPWNAAQEGVGKGQIANAYVKVMAHLSGATKLPELALSKELAYRDGMLKNNLRAELAAIGPTGTGIGRIVSEVNFFLYELSDRFTARVTWKAAFDDAASSGLSEKDAAQRADDVVRRTYASHDIAEKPRILRSKMGVAASVLFYSFSNRLLNAQLRAKDTLGRTLGDASVGAGDKALAAGKFAAQLAFMGLVGSACKYIAGRGPKKDEDVEKWLGWQVALEPFNTLPFVGSLLGGAVEHGRVSARAAPATALLGDAVERFQELAKKAEASGDAKDSDRALAAAEALFGAGLVLANVGPSQFIRTGGYAAKLRSGEVKPKNALEAASGLLYGEKKQDTRTPLSDLGEVLQ